jgi:pimeloyl-ACP methyl ester carboxylesterase
MGEYVNAGDVRTYYEVHGSGEPVVLLHGGFGTVESWTMQTPVLAERYRVYVPERRGHGRTPDVEGPITYETMAADTTAFLDRQAPAPRTWLGGATERLWECSSLCAAQSWCANWL